MSASSFTSGVVGVCAGLLLASCSGGGSGSTARYAVGGTVSGLQSAVVLQNNGGDDVTLSANGPFAFPTSLADGAAYAVTVRTQPVGPWQTCTVANGSGKVAGADARSTTVTCTTNTYFVGGSVTGLNASGLVVQENGGETLGLPSSAVGFGFATPVASGSPYLVTVLVQPTNPPETCTVANGSGTVGGVDVNVAVTCTPGGVACGTENGTVVTHTTNITANETWAGNGTVHVIANPLAIIAPATLSILPCAIVKLASGAGIDVRGDLTNHVAARLSSAGTDPGTGFVRFQNMDGGTAPAWGRLRALNSQSFINLESTEISGGGNVGGSQLNAVISMNGSSTLPDPTLKVVDVTISAPAGAGIYFSDTAFTSDSNNLTINDQTDALIAMPAMALGSVPSNVSSIRRQVNMQIKVVENANIFDNLTIATQIPIHFKTDGIHVGGLAPTFVPDLTLTLEAGVVLMFERASTSPILVTFGDLGQAQDKNAALVVHGTALAPVVLTSAFAIPLVPGGTPPAAGDWAGLWLATSNGSQIDHAVIEYAGGDAAIGPASCGPIDPSIHQRARNTAALIVGDGTDQQYVPPAGLVTNTVFRFNTGSYAIDAVWESNGFGPSLDATNAFGSGPQFCTQNKNLLIGGCVVSGTDESGCLVP